MSIMNDVSELQYQDVIFGGDFNVELVDKDDACKQLHSFVHDLQLNFVDKISSHDKTTYRVASTGACSTIDHFSVSHNLCRQIIDVQVLDSAVNFSDHCPLTMELGIDVSSFCSRSVSGSQSNNHNVFYFRWDIGD